MSVTIYDDMIEAASWYGEEGPGLIWALIQYAENGIVPDGDAPWHGAFLGMRKRAAMSAEAHRNGAKGGRPRKAQVDTVDNPLAEGFPEGLITPSENGSGGGFGHEMSRDENSRGENRMRFKPPTPEEVEAYCQEWGHRIDPEVFCDYYASKGWKVGKSPMKDWRAAVRGWWKRDHKMGQDPVNEKPSRAGKYAKFEVA